MSEEEIAAQLAELEARLETIRTAKRNEMFAEAKERIRQCVIYGHADTSNPLVHWPLTTSKKPTSNLDGNVQKKRGRPSKAVLGLRLILSLQQL